MDRCAVFVDAGYLFAEGGKLCVGSPKRKHAQLDGGAACKLLTQLAFEASGLPALRTYWYDGAPNGIPTTAQQLIASLPNVKLRLGRMNSKGRQKGVDSLIYRDLMTLARERAISNAFLLSGDEDLREGVRSTQDMGVHITLLGVATSDGYWNQSKELVNEADEVRELAKSELSKFLLKRRAPAQGTISSENPATAVETAASEYSANWLRLTTDTEWTALLAGRPRIPGTLDTDLLEAVEHTIGASLRSHEPLRRATRLVFWESVDRAKRTAPSLE